MKFCVDAGNTRIKWAIGAGEHWQQFGQCLSSQAAELDWSDWEAPSQQVWISNVAGEIVAQQLRAACAARGWQARFISPQVNQAGVRNGYARPQQLGVDRWAALIGAWQQIRGAVVVANCGTATTIDTLSDQGDFLGGLIVPGLTLMLRSLNHATAQLPLGSGDYATFPDNTQDALFSGAMQATLGAIQRQQAHSPHAALLVTGGAAQQVLPYLPDAVWVEHLVLQGISRISEEMDETQ